MCHGFSNFLGLFASFSIGQISHQQQGLNCWTQYTAFRHLFLQKSSYTRASTTSVSYLCYFKRYITCSTRPHLDTPFTIKCIQARVNNFSLTRVKFACNWQFEAKRSHKRTCKTTCTWKCFSDCAKKYSGQMCYQYLQTF